MSYLKFDDDPPSIECPTSDLLRDGAIREGQKELIKDCLEIARDIADLVSKRELAPRIVAVPPSIVLFPIPRLNSQSGELEIAAYSLNIASYTPESCRDLILALRNFNQFPSLAETKHISGARYSFGEAFHLLEALTIYLEEMTGVTNKSSQYRNTEFEEVLPLIVRADITSPFPGRPEEHIINGQSVKIDHSKLLAFKDALITFVNRKLPPEEDSPEAMGIYRPQSLIPSGMNLAQRTHILIKKAVEPKGG